MSLYETLFFNLHRIVGFFCLPISVISLATGRPNLDSYNRTTGFFVMTSIISANTSKSSIGIEGAKCIARTKGRSFKFGADMGRQILRTPMSQGLSKSYVSHLILISHTHIIFIQLHFEIFKFIIYLLLKFN